LTGIGTYLQALEKHLAPRLRVTGGIQALEQFGEFINKQDLEKGTDILMMWRGSETLEVVVKPSGSVDLAQASQPLSFQKSMALLAFNGRQDVTVYSVCSPVNSTLFPSKSICIPVV